jgi:hypothetical protein
MHYCEGEPFNIERLYRGSILNHHAFLLADENDTNARCASTVSVFMLAYDDHNVIRTRTAELDNEIKKIESELLGMENPIALDYLIKVPKEKKIARDF